LEELVTEAVGSQGAFGFCAGAPGHEAAQPVFRGRAPVLAVFFGFAILRFLSIGATSAPENPVPVAGFPGISVHGGEVPWVSATGRIASGDADVLEFVAVETAGRAYESLLTLDCKPSALQTALLLIGCKAQGKEGSGLVLELEWRTDAGVRRLPIEEALRERRTGKPPGPLPWRFTGSRFVRLPGAENEVFLADAEEAFIGLYAHDGLLIRLGEDFGNPYREAEGGFGANTDRLPPKGTPVKLILRKAPGAQSAARP
jgi:hypothetical protein